MNVNNPLPYDAVLLHALDDIVFIMEYTEESVLRYAFFNESALALTPVNKEHLGKTLQEVHEEDFAKKVQRYYERAMAVRSTVYYEDVFIATDGKEHFTKAKLTPFFDKDGKCTHIVSIVKDITEARLAQRAYEQASEHLKESRSRYRSLFDNNKDAIFSLGLDGRILSINQTVTTMLGYGLEELSGKDFFEELITAGKEKASNCFRGCRCKTADDFRIGIKAGNREIGALASFAPVEVKGEVVGWYAIIKDMTELDKMASQFIESENRFQIIAENSQDVIFLMDTNGVMVYVSPACESVYGYPPEEYIGTSPFHNVHPDDVGPLEEIFQGAVMEPSYTLEARIHHRTEGWRLSELRGTPVFDDSGQFVHLVSIARDISQQREREEQLVFYAFHDSLTGLPNRRQLKSHLQRYIDEPALCENRLAVGIVDIDDFKLINDFLGHEAGDGVIEEFGKRLAGVIGEGDLAARLGGDEFALVLHGVSQEADREAMLERLHAIVEEPIQFKDYKINIRISIGLVLVQPKGETASSLLKRADLAMYDSKKRKSAEMDKN